MLAAGTLRGTRAISLLALLVPLIDYAYSSPLQYLPSIPVYKRGDEPLEGINPELAEAFGETNSIKSLQEIDHTLAHESDNFKDDDVNVFLEEPKREHDYPLHAQAAENRSFASVNDPRNPKPKLLYMALININIYTSPDDRENRSQDCRRKSKKKKKSKKKEESKKKKKSKKKQPASKGQFTPVRINQKIEKLVKIEKEKEVEKEETKPNDLDAPYTIPLKSLKNTHNPHETNEEQDSLDESLTNLPKTSQNTDILQSHQHIFETVNEESLKKLEQTIFSSMESLIKSNKVLSNDWAKKFNEDTIFENDKLDTDLTNINLPELKSYDFGRSSVIEAFEPHVFI